MDPKGIHIVLVFSPDPCLSPIAMSQLHLPHHSLRGAQSAWADLRDGTTPRIKPYLSLHAEAEAPDDLAVEEEERVL